MKVIFLLVISILSFISISAQVTVPSVEWVAQIGGDGDEENWGLCTDTEGNVIITGNCYGQVIYGDGIVTNSHGYHRAFIAKYNCDGICLWAKLLESGAFSMGTEVCCDSKNNIYWTGYFDESVRFDNTTFIAEGENDIFIVKCDENGNYIWAKHIGGERNDRGWALKCDRNDNLFLSGWFMERALFKGYGEIISKGNSDIILAKIRPNGEYSWIKTYGGTEGDGGGQILIDTHDNIILSGVFRSPAIQMENGDTLKSKGLGDGYIIKHDVDGNYLWSKSFGGLKNDLKRGIAVDSKSNIYTVGFFTDEAFWDSDSSVTSSGKMDSYLMKYDSDGNFIWIRKLGGKEDDYAREITIDRNDNIYVSGYFSSTCKFGNDTIESRGMGDAYFVRYNSNGEFLGSSYFGSKGQDYFHCTIIDSWQNIYLSGCFNDYCFYNGDNLLRSQGGKDVFIVKLGSNCDITAFSYPEFNSQNIDKLNLKNNAIHKDDEIRLTGRTNFEKGAMWHKEQVPVTNGFTTDFSFRFSRGENGLFDDGSLPGADGIAFVVQNYSIDAIGNEGGGIGYDGIRNSLAVEFDTYRNYLASDQINDKNGNHVAIMSNGTYPNSSNHDLPSALAVNHNIPDIKSDSTVYYARIEYKIDGNSLRVFLDTCEDFTDPVLVLNDIEMSNLLDLENGELAWVGFTSATGNASENHDIISWEMCPKPASGGTSVDEFPFTEVDDKLRIYPNPVNEQVTIKYCTEKPGLVSLYLVDIFGSKVRILGPVFKNSGEYELEFSAKQYPTEQYYLILESADDITTKNMTIIK